MIEVAMISDTTGDQSSLSFWNLATGVRLKSYKNGTCAKNGFGFVKNDFILSAQHKKQLIHVHHAVKETLVKKIVCEAEVTALAISPDGNYCIVALVETIYVWQLCTGNLLNVLSKHYQRINSIKFTQDGSFFVSCGDDNLLLVWNFASVLQPKDPLSSSNACETPLHSLSEHSMPIQSVYVGVCGVRCHIATCSLDHTCKIYNLASGQLLCSFVFDVACTAVTMDLTETRLFTGGRDGNIFIVNLFQQKTGSDVHISGGPVINAHSKEVNCLSVSLDSTKLLSGSLDLTVKLWHINSKQCLRTFSFSSEITNALIIPYPGFLAQSRDTCSASVEIPNFKRSVYVSNDGNIDWNSMQLSNEDYFPAVLKGVRKDPDDKSKTSYLDEVLNECAASEKHSSSSSGDLKHATRGELLERLNALESMAQEFYKYASNKLGEELETSSATLENG